jgi:hypothetical protein
MRERRCGVAPHSIASSRPKAASVYSARAIRSSNGEKSYRREALVASAIAGTAVELAKTER